MVHTALVAGDTLKTLITLAYEGQLSKMEKAYLAQLLADALSDFRAARGPTPEQYLVRRYMLGMGPMPMSDESQEYKLKELRTRIGLAEKLHNAALAATFKEEPENRKNMCSKCGGGFGGYTAPEARCTCDTNQPFTTES